MDTIAAAMTRARRARTALFATSFATFPHLGERHALGSGSGRKLRHILG
jgi:hypothetical protein